MKTGKLMLLALAALFTIALLAGCNAPINPPVGATGAQLANPWKDATPSEAAAVLGGTFYNITTLDSSYKQYALMVTTDDAVKNNGLPPTAWVRFQKGDEDISLQMMKGGKLTDTQLAGKQTDVNGEPAYILHNSDGTAEIAWLAGGLMYQISTSKDWSDDALAALAEGVKAQ